MVRSERSAAGTVEQAATPVISTASPASRPRNIRPELVGGERASVLTRQECTSLSPSKVASTVLVFPMSMQSSTHAAYTRPVRRSSAMSRIGEEWVSAPTER